MHRFAVQRYSMILIVTYFPVIYLLVLISIFACNWINCNVPLGRICWERKSCNIQQFRTNNYINNREKKCRMIVIGGGRGGVFTFLQWSIFYLIRLHKNK